MPLTHRERAELAYRCYAQVLNVLTEHHEASSKTLVEAMAVESFRHALCDIDRRDEMEMNLAFERQKMEMSAELFAGQQEEMMKPLWELFESMGLKVPKHDKVMTPEERAELAKAFDDFRKRTEEAARKEKEEEEKGDGTSGPAP